MMLKEDELIKLINKRKELLRPFVSDPDISTEQMDFLAEELEDNTQDIDELLQKEIENET